jgi:hypothetical protein
MRTHGFTAAQLVDLVRAGLATATAQRVRAGGHAMEVTTLRITEAGRRALRRGTEEGTTMKGLPGDQMRRAISVAVLAAL